MEKTHKNTEDCCANDGCEACAIASGEHIDEHEQGDKKKELCVLGGGVVLFAAGLLLKNYETMSFVLLLLAYALLGAKIVYHAIKSLFAGNFMDENMLMSVATFGALALGDTAEAVSVMLFYRVGEHLQEFAVDRSRRSIKKAINMRSDKARVLRDTELEVRPSEVEIGECILVRPGERIPLDGVVESGESYLDYSAITGEPAPVFIEAGGETMSGGINKSGALTIKVTKDYDQSTVSRIMEAVEDAVRNKPQLQSFISRFSRIYTPIVIALAVLVAIVPPVLGLGVFRDWLHKALLFLVISCPCALVLSVPLTFFAGLANASSKGVLFKGANILETVANAKAFAFDKTGTLTKGVFRVSKVIPADGRNEKEVLAYAAALERMSTHPVGRALVEADEQHYTAEHVTELAGYGVSGTVEGKTVIAGNAKLIELNKIAMPERVEAGTVVYIAIAGTYAGAIIISDQLKEDAADAIRLLKEKTGYVAMLTGDNETAAREAAKAVGTQNVYYSLLPEDKLSVMRSIREQRGTTIFVGDGINDAPVLAGADAGCTIGLKSTDAAVEAADLVLMRDDLSLLPHTVDLSRRTMRVAKINVTLALIIKVAVMVLGLLGYAEMWMAIFADVGATLLCVLIALTLMPRRKQ